jgi:hypothetical protein
MLCLCVCACLLCAYICPCPAYLPGRRAPAGRAPAGHAPAGRAPGWRAPAGRAPAGRASAGHTPAGHAPAGHTLAGLSVLAALAVLFVLAVLGILSSVQVIRLKYHSVASSSSIPFFQYFQLIAVLFPTRSYDVLLKRLAQVHRSLLELIEYQLPYKKAWASAFFVDHDTTTVEQSYESHMGTQYCNLRTRGSSRLQ